VQAVQVVVLVPVGVGAPTIEVGHGGRRTGVMESYLLSAARRRIMNISFIGMSLILILPLLVWTTSTASGQDTAPPDDRAAVVDSRPFSAIKYAKRIKILADGKQLFVRNERYPTKIARDSNGRLMMQIIKSDDLSPECDQPRMQEPPRCPVWSVFVIDPITRTLTHWTEGELAGHGAVEMQLSEDDIEHAISSTSKVPEIPDGFSSDDGQLSAVDLGVKVIDGIPAHGVRATMVRTILRSGKEVRVSRVHEVWIAPEWNLIVKVVDGDPYGFESVWGLAKVSSHPDPSFFRPPQGYEIQHQPSNQWAVGDFEYLETWFEK
jgi:hypothetical protein